MNGVFALFDDQIYFNEVLQKTNLQYCSVPLENWMLKNGGFFIPMSSIALGVLDVIEHKEHKVFSDIDLPTFCGIMVTSEMRIFEVGVADGKLKARAAPVGKGVTYVRGNHRDTEEALTAALRITKDLRLAVELARRATLCVPGRPVFTSLPVVAWAAHKNQPELIRTVDNKQLTAIIRAEVKKEKKTKPPKEEQT